MIRLPHGSVLDTTNLLANDHQEEVTVPAPAVGTVAIAVILLRCTESNALVAPTARRGTDSVDLPDSPAVSSLRGD